MGPTKDCCLKDGIARLREDPLKAVIDGVRKVAKTVADKPQFEYPDEKLGAPLSKFEKVWTWSYADMVGKTLSLKRWATPKRFRLIDCALFCDQRVLKIFECKIDAIYPAAGAARVCYAAISHVWKGKIDPNRPESFTVEVEDIRHDGDRISLDVLKAACQASIKRGARYIWLDRLCIMQTSETDKDWQVGKMADIYRNCHTCLVLPGGLNKLVGFGETTGWIYRSWTLQEAMLPKEVWCIYIWERGNGRWMEGDQPSPFGEIIEIQKRHSAMSQLRCLLAHSGGNTGFEADRAWSMKFMDVPFLCNEFDPLRILATAMRADGQETREISIWRCAMMRTSSREVDTVLSIMGLFGVELDPRRYRSDGNDNSLRATIDLCKAILQGRDGKRGRAFWLGASATLRQSPDRCCLPFIPGEAEDGIPVVKPGEPCSSLLKDVGEWQLVDAPQGVMGDSGSIQFTSPVSGVTIGSIEPLEHSCTRDYGPPGFRSITEITVKHPNRTQSSSKAHFTGKAGTHAVVIGRGKLVEFGGYAPGFMDESNYDWVVLMVLKQRADGGWYKTGLATVKPEFIRSWNKQTVQVGGQEQSLTPTSRSRRAWFARLVSLIRCIPCQP
ncbi:heterokaryon incompatibility protein-domain-containing protein [Suillus lakei]|nr:heterokaryon incompatibility protein-domain-containing protein [Suillus lakei]